MSYKHDMLEAAFLLFLQQSPCKRNTISKVKKEQGMKEQK